MNYCTAGIVGSYAFFVFVWRVICCPTLNLLPWQITIVRLGLATFAAGYMYLAWNEAVPHDRPLPYLGCAVLGAGYLWLLVTLPPRARPSAVSRSR